uniref:Sec-independent protein translocase component TatA/E n=1 Tax=Ancoracysta twista TaxID=2044563 RepID=A0A2H4R8H8_9EUKA|nr:Sec-independent protein translocase component TatA/E [Ancoracysta twista]ATY40961.1 Sec-independent protein translocase component TatA/E [Ancoracysta twista]
MNVGFGQLILIALMGLLLFGNLPKMANELGRSILGFKKGLEDKKTENKKDNLKSST